MVSISDAAERLARASRWFHSGAARFERGRDSDGGFGLAAKITVEIPGMEHEKAQQLAAAAHALCPYSRATRGNIDVEVTVV